MRTIAYFTVATVIILATSLGHGQIFTEIATVPQFAAANQSLGLNVNQT
jgi:hypothetical protein